MISVLETTVAGTPVPQLVARFAALESTEHWTQEVTPPRLPYPEDLGFMPPRVIRDMESDLWQPVNEVHNPNRWLVDYTYGLPLIWNGQIIGAAWHPLGELIGDGPVSDMENWMALYLRAVEALRGVRGGPRTQIECMEIQATFENRRMAQADTVAIPGGTVHAVVAFRRGPAGWEAILFPGFNSVGETPADALRALQRSVPVPKDGTWPGVDRDREGFEALFRESR